MRAGLTTDVDYHNHHNLILELNLDDFEKHL